MQPVQRADLLLQKPSKHSTTSKTVSPESVDGLSLLPIIMRQVRLPHPAISEHHLWPCTGAVMCCQPLRLSDRVIVVTEKLRNPRATKPLLAGLGPKPGFSMSPV